MSGTGGHLRHALAVLLTVQALVVAAGRIERSDARHDFASFYGAALTVVAGEGERLYEAVDRRALQDRYEAVRARGFAGDYVPSYLYHPFWALVAAPLALLPYETAADLFAALGVLLLLVWLGVAWRQGVLGPLEAASVCLATVLFYPHSAPIDYAQWSLHVLPLLGVVGLAPAARWSGVALGFLILTRPYLGLVLVVMLLDARMRRAGIACIVFLVGSSLIAMLALGARSVIEFVAVAVGHGETTLVYAGGQSLLHQVYRVIVGTSVAEERHAAIVAVPWVVQIVYLSFAVGIVAATLWVTRRVNDLSGKIALATAGALLATPYAWTHHFGLLLIPALAAMRGGNRVAAGLALAGLLVCHLPLRYSADWIRLLTFNCYAGAAIVAIAASLALVNRNTRQVSAPS